MTSVLKRSIRMSDVSSSSHLDFLLLIIAMSYGALVILILSELAKYLGG